MRQKGCGDIFIESDDPVGVPYQRPKRPEVLDPEPYLKGAAGDRNRKIEASPDPQWHH